MVNTSRRAVRNPALLRLPRKTAHYFDLAGADCEGGIWEQNTRRIVKNGSVHNPRGGGDGRDMVGTCPIGTSDTG